MVGFQLPRPLSQAPGYSGDVGHRCSRGLQSSHGFHGTRGFHGFHGFQGTGLVRFGPTWTYLIRKTAKCR